MITLEATDIEQAHQYFARTLKRVTDATTGLSEAQYRFKSAPDRWSIAEILEHLVIVHERVLVRIQEQIPTAPAPPMQSSTAGRWTRSSSTKSPTVPSRRRLPTSLRQPASSHHRNLLTASLGVTSASPTM